MELLLKGAIYAGLGFAILFLGVVLVAKPLSKRRKSRTTKKYMEGAGGRPAADEPS